MGILRDRYHFCNSNIRSGKSIGKKSVIFYTHGTVDFIAKLQTILKKCSESEYWLGPSIESRYCEDKTILENCIELKKTRDARCIEMT